MDTKLGFIGKNIRFLRRQSSLTLAELAARVGMSEGPLGRIERGLNAPSASVIYRLSKALGASVNALFAEANQDPSAFPFEGMGDPFLVNIGGEEAVLPGKIQGMAGDVIQAFQSLEDICKAQKRAKIPLLIPFEPTEWGMEDLSETVRRIMEVRHGVVFDYFELLENQGFRVVVLPLPKAMDSFSYYDPPNQNAFFFLNARKNPERQLFRLAYELGRVFILNQAMKQGADLFGARCDALSGAKRSFGPEEGARRFAATFLMPRTSVRDTASQLGVQKGFWSFELLLRIKHRFGVSAEAFLYRLHELGLIDPDLIEPLKEKIYDYYEKTGFGEPDFSRRVLTPNGRLWDLALTARQVVEARDEVLTIEKTLKKWRVVKK
ncbi:MAG: ImmA/IrrE family metallo-endopeptidase [Deltaproteobacteria bacterium]|nr:ImmA/IrrE family metallo-endopeptidase [Deltaproteobacteria bacterium]